MPYAQPSFLGRQPQGAANLPAEALRPGGAPLDLSAIDPLAPKYAEWARRTAQLKGAEPERMQSLGDAGKRKQIEVYGLSAMAERTIAVYQRLMHDQ